MTKRRDTSAGAARQGKVNNAMSSFPEVRPYPEWRQLKTNIEPLLQEKTQYSYDDLEKLAGVDIRSERGRQQFYKFRKQALRDWRVWFENAPGFGYVLIPASDQPKAAIKRVGSAKRKVKLAGAINSGTRTEALTPAQLALHAQMGALIADLAHTFNSVSRKLTATAAKFRLDLPEAALKALEAPSGVTKKNPGRAPRFRIETDMAK